MAGTNKILSPGQILFREGDESDGMYIVRRGKINVFLEKDGANEVRLAVLEAGAMLGEMALFDKKPRSASAKAMEEVEVTKISNADFQKIMKQIPRWFVALMASLSTRLRETNDRLQEIETQTKGVSLPLQELLRCLHVLNVLWYKDGEKRGKNWVIEKSTAEAEIALVLALPVEEIARINKALVEAGLFSSGSNNYRSEIYIIENRGDLQSFIDFTSKYTERYPKSKSVPKELADLLSVLMEHCRKAAYERITCSLADLERDGRKRNLKTDNWEKIVHYLDGFADALASTSTSDGLALKVHVKGFARLKKNYDALIRVTKEI